MKAEIGMQLKCPKTLIYSALFPLFLGCQTTGVIPFGKYCRMSPLVFSFRPRSHEA